MRISYAIVSVPEAEDGPAGAYSTRRGITGLVPGEAQSLPQPLETLRGSE